MSRRISENRYVMVVRTVQDRRGRKRGRRRDGGEAGGVPFEESLFGRRRETEDQNLGEEDYKNEIDLV